ncbi:UNVERIFIED_CONTAM: hypothetical protein FKN15_037643 [Acipenser sinensis]
MLLTMIVLHNYTEHMAALQCFLTTKLQVSFSPLLFLARQLNNGHYDSLVFLSEVVVQNPVHDSVETTVEVSHEVAGREKPLWDGEAQTWVHGHCQPDEIEWCPTHGEEHEHHKHGQEVPDVVGLDFETVVRLDASPHLDDQDPDPQVAVSHDADGQDEVDHHHGDCVQRADGLREGAGVDAGVVLQGLHEPVRHDGQDGEDPHQDHVADGVLVREELVVLEAVADIAVAVDGDACDVEDGADNAQPHQETADLTVDVAQAPAIMENGRENQRVRIDGYHQVCYSQTNHKGMSCRDNKGVAD